MKQSTYIIIVVLAALILSVIGYSAFFNNLQNQSRQFSGELKVEIPVESETTALTVNVTPTPEPVVAEMFQELDPVVVELEVVEEYISTEVVTEVPTDSLENTEVDFSGDLNPHSQQELADRQKLWELANTTPCPTEDSDNCFWDAQERGNGLGHSFTVINGEVVYWVY